MKKVEHVLLCKKHTNQETDGYGRDRSLISDNKKGNNEN